MNINDCDSVLEEDPITKRNRHICHAFMGLCGLLAIVACQYAGTNYETVRVLEKHKKNYVYVSVENEQKYYSVHDMPLLSFDAQTLFSSLEVGKEYCVATRGLSTLLLGKNITSVSEGACQGLEEKFTLNKALNYK